MTFDAVPVVLPQVRAGKLKALAVATPKRSPLAPEVPDSETRRWLKVVQGAGIKPE